MAIYNAGLADKLQQMRDVPVLPGALRGQDQAGERFEEAYPSGNICPFPQHEGNCSTMNALSVEHTVLLVVDFQSRLMPVIENAAPIIANANRLLKAASILEVPSVVTEQNTKGLGKTLDDLAIDAHCRVVPKQTFNACLAPAFMPRLLERENVVVVGCETHVCVLQTVLGLLDAGRNVFAVRDAMGSRKSESKETALRRMERHGAEIVTTEMVLFELLETVDHPHFRKILDLIK